MTVALCKEKGELRCMDSMVEVFKGQVSVCKKSGGKSTKIGFGEYLLHEGKIDLYDLELALNYQREWHIVLGVLAVQEKCLSGRQLRDVLDFQMEGGGRFGEVAMKMGFLNEENVDAILKIQGENHIKIGEVLVLSGSIRRADMESCLQHFHCVCMKKRKPICLKERSTLDLLERKT